MTIRDIGLGHGHKRQDAVASRMRQWNLTHGRGCRTRAAAIRRRLAVRAQETAIESQAVGWHLDTPKTAVGHGNAKAGQNG